MGKLLRSNVNYVFGRLCQLQVVFRSSREEGQSREGKKLRTDGVNFLYMGLFLGFKK